MVVRKPGSTLDEAALIEWSRGQLHTFKCPRSVTFVDTLPRTASGKLQKAKLREQH